MISLVGGPDSVGGGFFCNNNKLTSLEGCPINVGDCFGNDLLDDYFKGLPYAQVKLYLDNKSFI